jgi:hypothetical protein
MEFIKNWKNPTFSASVMLDERSAIRQSSACPTPLSQLFPNLSFFHR